MPDSETKLSSLVHVRPGSIRSIRVERDLEQSTLAEAYIFTAQARRTLARLMDGAEGLTRTRAWTLTGPYGSGKSYFGLL